MKFTKGEDGREVTVIVVWSDHRYECQKCSAVEIDSSATFVHACALGAKLLLEELQKRAPPNIALGRKKVEEWAKKTGGFAEFNRTKPELVKKVMRYVGDK